MEKKGNSKKQYEPKVKNVPNNEMLEKSILSIIMNDKDVAQDIFARVKDTDFYSARHQIIYRHLYERNKIGASFDVIGATLSMTEEDQSKIGGPAYLTEVSSFEYSSATFEDDIQALRSLANLRRVLQVTDIARNRVYNNESADDIIAYTQDEFFALKSANETRDLLPINESSPEVISKIQEMYIKKMDNLSLATGFPELDKYLNGGFRPSQMIVLAARPSCGKTSFAMNIVANIARKDADKVIAVFNLEMAREELLYRLYANASGVNSQLISNSSKLTDAQMNRVYGAQKIFDNTEVFIDDSSKISMNEIALKVRRLKNREGKVDLVVIDHMQLVDDQGSRSRSRYEQITDISRLVKVMAKELQVPVLVLSQMSRDFEKDKITLNGEQPKARKPVLADLRESGAIEQDADVVLFLSEADFQTINEEDKAIDLTIAKNRSGERDVECHFDADLSTMNFKERINPFPKAKEDNKKDEEEEEAEPIPANNDFAVSYDDVDPVPPPMDLDFNPEFMDELRNSNN